MSDATLALLEERLKLGVSVALSHGSAALGSWQALVCVCVCVGCGCERGRRHVGVGVLVPAGGKLRCMHVRLLARRFYGALLKHAVC